MNMCPCCKGYGVIDDKRIVLTPLQRRIYDILCRSQDGISVQGLIDMVYADRLDGGPASARSSISVTVHNANLRLAPYRQKIVSTKGHFSVYRLELHDVRSPDL